MGIFCDLSLKKMIEYRAVDKEKKDTITAYVSTLEPSQRQLTPSGCSTSLWLIGSSGRDPSGENEDAKL